MSGSTKNRAQILQEYLSAQERLASLEAENQRLRESNFHLSKELEEKETTVQNLFSYIENISGPAV